MVTDGAYDDLPTRCAGPTSTSWESATSYSDAPAVTLTEGLQSTHHAIIGCRIRLPLDHDLARNVAGGAVAHPSWCGTWRSVSRPW